MKSRNLRDVCKLSYKEDFEIRRTKRDRARLSFWSLRDILSLLSVRGVDVDGLREIQGARFYLGGNVLWRMMWRVLWHVLWRGKEATCNRRIRQGAYLAEYQ